MVRKSAHLTRITIEGMSSYSPYKGGRITYQREYDPNPQVSVGLVEKMDIERAIKILLERGELSQQEVFMLSFVMADGRLSRRNISEIIENEFGILVDQRTVSRRLESAYNKIAKFLGWDYSDYRVFRMVAKKMGRPAPYILSDEEIDKIQTLMERA